MTRTSGLLSADAFLRATGWIEAHGRPLEQAQLAHRFAAGSAADVHDELAAFQNEDGGFGRALEPDVRAPESSALCTSIALRVLRTVDAPSDAPLVIRALDYLLETLDRDTAQWRIVPATVAAHPHAPWWTQEGREARFAACFLNPTAELLGALYEHATHVPPSDLALVRDQVLGTIDALDEIEMHDLLCCLRLLQCPVLPEEIRGHVIERLSPLIAQTVETDPSRWAGYNLRPLGVVLDPESPFLPGLEDAVARNLEHEIEAGETAGRWTPTWSWGDEADPAWRAARDEWTGELTLQKLEVLAAFGRIEGQA